MVAKSKEEGEKVLAEMTDEAITLLAQGFINTDKDAPDSEEDWSFFPDEFLGFARSLYKKGVEAGAVGRSVQLTSGAAYETLVCRHSRECEACGKYHPASYAGACEEPHSFGSPEEAAMEDMARLGAALADMVQEMLCDQETLKEPVRNEALCEKARLALTRVGR